MWGDRGVEGGELMRLHHFNAGAHRRVWKEGAKGGCGGRLESLAVLEPAMQRAHTADMLALARLVPSDDRLVIERRLHLEQGRVRRLGG